LIAQLAEEACLRDTGLLQVGIDLDPEVLRRVEDGNAVAFLAVEMDVLDIEILLGGLLGRGSFASLGFARILCVIVLYVCAFALLSCFDTVLALLRLSIRRDNS
jgi:hypothetical protein